jgi:hypothetical protein
MSEWKECILRDVIIPKGYIRGPFGSSLKRNELHETGIPVYEQKNCIDPYFLDIFDDMNLVSLVFSNGVMIQIIISTNNQAYLAPCSVLLLKA